MEWIDIETKKDVDALMDRIGGMSDMDTCKISSAEPHCPKCGSNNIAEILWGMPDFDEELERDLDEGRVVLGGCCVSFDDPKYECNDCMHRFGRSMFAEDLAEIKE